MPEHDFGAGVVTIDRSGAMELWGTRTARALLSTSVGSVLAVESVHQFRHFTYPTICVDLGTQGALSARPVKQQGLCWRAGQTSRESAASAASLAQFAGEIAG